MSWGAVDEKDEAYLINSLFGWTVCLVVVLCKQGLKGFTVLRHIPWLLSYKSVEFFSMEMESADHADFKA